MDTLRAEQLISDNLNIPTLPDIVLRINALVDDPKVGIRDIGALVSEDAPLTANVLRIANCAYYGLRERCISAEHATAVLGPRVLRNIVMQASVLRTFDHLKSLGELDVEDIWRHSIAAAQTCELVARRCTERILLAPSEFYVCGLLHDLGKVVMLDSLRTEYVDAWRRTEEGVQLHVAEREAFGFDHTEVGALITRRWGLPEPVTRAVELHHGTRAKLGDDPVVLLVSAVDRILNDEEDGEPGIDAETAAALGLDERAVIDTLEFARNIESAIEL